MVIFGVGNKNWLIAIQPAFVRAPAVIFVWKKIFIPTGPCDKTNHTTAALYHAIFCPHALDSRIYTAASFLFAYSVVRLYMYAPFMNNAAAAV
jgi:hypothetical protein